MSDISCWSRGYKCLAESPNRVESGQWAVLNKPNIYFIVSAKNGVYAALTVLFL